MRIRYAKPMDLEHIAEIYVTNHRKTYQSLLSPDYFKNLTAEYALHRWEQYIDTREKQIWVASEHAHILGFAAGMADTMLENTWYLDAIHVSEHARGKGVGTQLIKTCGNFALGKNYKKMSVCIVRGNETARALYDKLGAKHFTYFEDDFCGTKSQSEKINHYYPLNRQERLYTQSLNLRMFRQNFRYTTDPQFPGAVRHNPKANVFSALDPFEESAYSCVCSIHPYTKDNRTAHNPALSIVLPVGVDSEYP